MTIQVPSVLFSLSGMRDHEQFLASPEALEWVYTRHAPGMHKIPQNVQASLAPFLSPLSYIQDKLNDEHELSTGSAENDKALVLLELCQNYDTTKEAMQALASLDLLVDEYEGGLY